MSEKSKLVNYTHVSDLIKLLSEVIRDHGDIPVAVIDDSLERYSTKLYIEVCPYYFDGGYVISIDKNNKQHHLEWVSSRTRKESKNVDHEVVLKIHADGPKVGDSLNGEVIKPKE